MASFVRSFINSLIISLLFALVAVCFFIGDFPPSMTKLKKVYAEYQGLIKIKQKIIDQNGQLSTEDLVQELQAGNVNQVKKLAEARNPFNPDARMAELEQLSKEQNLANNVPRAPQATIENAMVAEAPPSKAEIPDEWKDQFYALRTEVFRLNQRIIELERKK